MRARISIVPASWWTRRRAGHSSCSETATAGLLGLLVGLVVVTSLVHAAVEMKNDPNGFGEIRWGTSLQQADGFALVDAGDRIKRYERQERASLGDIPVEAMQYFTIDGKFARVAVRYRGKATHDQIVAYLQSQYGPLDRTPGQIARGLNQQFNWRGEHTEINIMYQPQGDRGHVFFESRVLAPLFNDMLPEHGY